MKPIQLAWCEIHDAPRDGPWCLKMHIVKGVGDEGSECLFVDVEVAPISEKPWMLVIPLSADAWVTLQIPRRLSLASWEQFMSMLEVMKPGLVATENQADALASQVEESER